MSRVPGRAALALVALIVIAASSFADPAIGWENSDSFGALEVAASASADKSCVPSVASQFGALKDHPDALGFFPGASPTPTVYKHYQGIQRLPSAGVLYGLLFLLMKKYASKSSSGERIRSNRLAKGSTTAETPPPSRDRVSATSRSMDRNSPPHGIGRRSRT